MSFISSKSQNPSPTKHVILYYCCIEIFGVSINKSNVCFFYWYSFDCGVIMRKAIEIWDGEEKYDGKSMLDYTNVC